MKKPVLMAVALAAACWGVPAARAQQAPLPSNPHGPLRQGMDCADCHTSSGWKPMRPDPRFDHARDTRFALNGAHVSAACTRCHLDLRFDEPKAAPNDCTSCHVDVHRGNFPGECIQCHTQTDFHDVQSVQIHQRTGFPLTGAHLNTPCESCHRTEAGGFLSAVPRDCVSCHRSAMDAAAASGVDHSTFPRDCTQCHTTLAWAGGTNFDHVAVSGGYVLEGAHAVQRCEACHVRPGFTLRFAPAPASNQDCFACHAQDYQAEHAGQGYPTTCTDCHTVRSWASTFDHDAREFPIYSGAHRGQWQSCATCHVTPGTFSDFTCLSCHEHSQASMDDKHSGRSGYSYQSQACYSCHPRGRH